MRYEKMFQQLEASSKMAFIPFTMLFDPDRNMSLAILKALSDAGADALEVGIAFTDPVADGPVIQKAALRALRSGSSVDGAFSLIKEFRKYNDEIPIGILTYANLVYQKTPEVFYKKAKEAGVDSVLIADVPMLEATDYCVLAKEHGIAPVLIAPPNLPIDKVPLLAKLGAGYTYVVTRAGVTGARESLTVVDGKLLAALKEHHAPPAVFGFGISSPDHVRSSKLLGAYGAISGSFLVNIIEKHLNHEQQMLTSLKEALGAMKDAT